MEIFNRKGSTAQKIFRVSISIVVATITAKIVFIIICSITLVPLVSDSSFFSGFVLFVALVSAIISGATFFIKLNEYLKTENQKI